MNWWDYVLIAISAGCTFFSIIGAIKSIAYYKKSKQLTVYANTNVAYIESQKIISTLTEMLKLANMNKQRGRNYVDKVIENGELIRNSISKIRESLLVEDYKEIQDILNTQKLNVEMYIDSFISGAVLVEEKIKIDDNFNTCQQAFCNMQLLIRKKIDIIGEKLK